MTASAPAASITWARRSTAANCSWKATRANWPATPPAVDSGRFGREFAPGFGQGLAGFRIDEIRRDLRQRLEHERVLQFRPRDAQVAGTIEDQIVVEHDVDVERAAGEARHVAAPAVRVFQRVQPVVEPVYVPVGLDHRGAVDEVRA